MRNSASKHMRCVTTHALRHSFPRDTGCTLALVTSELRKDEAVCVSG